MSARAWVRKPVRLRGGRVVPRWTLLTFPVLLLSVDLVIAHRTAVSTALGLSGLASVLVAGSRIRRHRES